MLTINEKPPRSRPGSNPSLGAIGSDRLRRRSHPTAKLLGMDSMFSLDRRVAIVTGASSGLGMSLARGLAAAGARVAVVARRRDRLDLLAGQIRGVAVTCDLLDREAPRTLVAEVVDRLGPPEILVNAAGINAGIVTAESESAEAIDDTLAVNLVAPYRLCQEAFPHMRRVGRGSIVNVSSVSGMVGIPGVPQAAYAASKLGLSGLTKELAVQWARHSIRVNTLAAGFFRSELTESMYTDTRSLDWLRRNTPLPIDGSPDDFVGAVLWLTSDAGRYVTGQTITVDGGWTSR
jgi:NAD(P)-dependent dehydrogenase (short-subunit alcohol dehydrogenase family)